MKSHARILAAVVLVASSAPAFAELVIAGANLEANVNHELNVPFRGFTGEWVLEAELAHNPDAGPMIKRFEAPVTDIPGHRILLDANQPRPFVVHEDFQLLDGDLRSLAVSDWHEVVLTPGWQWVLPGDDRFPNLFADNQSLITRNGQPHPWEHIPGISPIEQGTRVDVKFPAIQPGDVLDVHKALLWVGTPDNTIWGDDSLDALTVVYDESSIRVWEYPTPEPATAVMLAFGSLALLGRGRRHHHR